MKLSNSEFIRISQSHHTPEEHRKLAAHLSEHAAEHESDAKINEELATTHEKTEPRLSGEERHYAAHSREAAEAMRNLAKIHDELAKEHAIHSHA
jgi:septal ring factor EnvC (AmiA/AmiB activator)